MVIASATAGTKAKDLETTLHRLVIRQGEAIHEIIRTYQTYLAGLSPNRRPIGTFLFLGPTGTGKTRAVEATAEALIGNPRAVTKIDCVEFRHSHDIAKLVGSPPEIEKASEALSNLLLGILDKATLTLGDNRKVDFSKALIFITSNLVAAEMSSLVSPKLGFGGAPLNHRNCAPALSAKQEFINRLDRIVVFRALGNEELNRLIEIELELVQQRVRTASGGKPFHLNVTDSARRFLLTEGIDLRYDARPHKRTIERLLVHPLSNLMARGPIQHHDRICVTHKGDSSSLTFFRETEVWENRETSGVAAA